MNNLSLKDDALAYAKKGLKIFPAYGITNGQCDCKNGARCSSPGKHPISENGFKDATSDSKKVLTMWKQHPNANIGLVVGPDAGIFVLDIDPRNKGDQSFKNLSQRIPFTKTYKVQSSRRGFHLYFKHPEGNVSFAFPKEEYPGIDAKYNGYVIAPPSLHASGERYKVVKDCEYAQLPDEFLVLIKKPDRSKSSTETKSSEDEETKIFSALEHIPAASTDYDEWIKIGIAIHSWNPSRFDIWDEWSQVDSARYDQYRMPSKWDSFSASTHSANTITIATLYHLAKKNGWNPKQDQEGYAFSKSLFPPIEFPFHVFEAKIQKLFYELASQMQVEPEPAACIALAIIGAALGNSIRLEIRNQHTESPFIWFILIAKSGYGKTPIEKILTAEIKSREARLFSNYKKARKEFEKLKDEDKKTTPYPHYETYISSDFTIEGLANLFTKNPRGTLILKDEVMGVIKGLNQYKGKGGNDREKFLELFNAQSWKIDRVKDSRFIPNTGASIVGGAQPSAIKEVFNDDCINDGLLPRFLFFSAKDFPKKYKKEECINTQNLNAWNRLVSKAYGVRLAITEDEGIEHTLIKLSDEALDAYLNHLNGLEEVRQLLEPHIQAFIPKMATYLGKFCAILHCMDCLSKNQASIDNNISEKIVEDAYKLVRFFLGQLVDSFEKYSVPDQGAQDGARMTRILKAVFSELKTDRIPLEAILKKYNEELRPEFNLNPNQTQRLSKMIKALGFKTERGSKGYYYVEWNQHKVDELTKKYSSPASPPSPTISADPPEQVNEVMQVKQSEINTGIFEDEEF